MDKMLTNKIDQPWNLSDSIYSDLILSKNLIYDPCNFKCSKLVLETESIEYGACSFSLDLAHIKFRIAKITPTKIGQFVTFWKRTGNGPIQPYDTTDKIDFFVVV
ncbi:MAG: MepB family protein, partial [Burkholderiales bacterium]